MCDNSGFYEELKPSFDDLDAASEEVCLNCNRSTDSCTWDNCTLLQFEMRLSEYAHDKEGNE